MDEHVLHTYRSLMDLEDAAFDELEHSFEDGDRDSFETDLAAWQQAAVKRLAFLQRLGVGV
jgi:hypothetical protein